MRDVSRDRERARSLAAMSEQILERIDATDAERFPSQVVKDYYEAMHSLLEALACCVGKKSAGKGAHQQLIDWAAEEYDISERDRTFLQQLRKHRNRITYEGFSIDYSYLERNEDRLRTLIQQVQEELETELAK